MSRDRSLRGHAEVGTGTQRGAPDRQIGSKVNAVASGYLTRLSKGKKTREKARKKRKKRKKKATYESLQSYHNLTDNITICLRFLFLPSLRFLFRSFETVSQIFFFLSLNFFSLSRFSLPKKKKKRERDKKNEKWKKKVDFVFLCPLFRETLFSLS